KRTKRTDCMTQAERRQRQTQAVSPTHDGLNVTLSSLLSFFNSGHCFDALRSAAPRPRLWVRGRLTSEPNAHYEGLTMSAYQNEKRAVAALKDAAGNGWSAISPEYAARMRIHDRFLAGLDWAKYTVVIIRKDM